MEVAVLGHFKPRQNIIVPNVSWGIHYRYHYLHECDVLVLSKSDYATEIEIKISKADLLKDKTKPHGHIHPLIRRVFFAVPEKLVELAKSEIDSRFGILAVTKRGRKYVVTEVRAAKQLHKVKWTQQQRQQLMRLGCMRILGLKKKLI